MKDTDYTFAVARIRCNENNLLTGQDLNSVIAAADYGEAVRRLNDKGYDIGGTDYSEALDEKLKAGWAFIESVLPDKTEFDSIIIKNDFQNLKVILKSLVCDKKTDGLFAFPCKYDPAEIEALVRARENSKLPEVLRHADRSAYNILTKTHFAQLGDSVIDRASLENAIIMAKKADNHIMYELAQVYAATADIKVLYRCILAGKAESFMNRCVCECDAFDKKDIIKAAQGGMDSFFEFLSHTSYAGAAEALAEGAAAFEKWCDDAVMNIVYGGKNTAFGIAPLAAYYIAVQAEVRNVRIILSAKLNGLPDDAIRARVRELYV